MKLIQYVLICFMVVQVCLNPLNIYIAPARPENMNSKRAFLFDLFIYLLYKKLTLTAPKKCFSQFNYIYLTLIFRVCIKRWH